LIAAAQTVATVMFMALVVVSAGISVSGQTASGGRPSQAAKPSAVFKDIWIDYDVAQGTDKGMRIHVKFTVNNMKNLDSYLALYFETAEGVRLRDKDDSTNSATGEVAVYRELKPGYDVTDYDDMTLFMPYDQLDLEDGDWKLRIDVDVIYKAGGLIQHLTFKEFDYSQGGDEVEPEKVATLKRIWVDYNVTRGGRKGMLVHVNFEVTGMKGVDGLLAVRVRKGDENYLESASAGFSNADGEFEVTYAIKPGYAVAVYEDATVFIPFNEMVISKGTWDLELDADLRYEGGDLIQHLGFHPFEFKR
jgi:hypothetical protein